jgi:MYXO-CTERM domain-containing protein
VSITSALASNSMLKISQVIKYEWISLEYNQKVVVLNDTMYGAPIPAPGAIALLGLAGLAGGRRRR